MQRRCYLTTEREKQKCLAVVGRLLTRNPETRDQGPGIGDQGSGMAKPSGCLLLPDALGIR